MDQSVTSSGQSLGTKNTPPCCSYTAVLTKPLSNCRRLASFSSGHYRSPHGAMHTPEVGFFWMFRCVLVLKCQVRVLRVESANRHMSHDLTLTAYVCAVEWNMCEIVLLYCCCRPNTHQRVLACATAAEKTTRPLSTLLAFICDAQQPSTDNSSSIRQPPPV